MAGILRCRICGKEYEGCRSSNLDPTTFRWQDVACCEEHGNEYFQKILESRGQAPAKKQETKKSEKKIFEEKETVGFESFKPRSKKYNSDEKTDDDKKK